MRGRAKKTSSLGQDGVDLRLMLFKCVNILWMYSAWVWVRGWWVGGMDGWSFAR